MNCDSFAAEAILQAERDELAYIDAQCAQALKNAYPALAEPVRVFGGSSKGVAIHVIPLLNEGENTEQPKDPKKEDQKVITGEGEQKRSKTPEPQEDSFPGTSLRMIACWTH